MGRFVRKQKLSSPVVDAAKSGSKAGLGCLVLFTLPFTAVGIVMTAVVAGDLWTWTDAQNWVETPTTLLEAELESDSDGDGTTYRATARYEFEFNGQRHESNDVSLHVGSDNIGSYQRERGRELEALLAAGGRTVCYVDPANPTKAMLFRDLRPGMLAFKLLFAVVFGGIGFGLLVGGVIGLRSDKRWQQAKASRPEEPWRWRDDWAAGRIKSSANKLAWFVTFFAVFWNAISWPAILVAFRGAADDDGPPLLLLALFPAAGTFVATWAGYLWLRRLRWGVSEFEMAAVPGVLGGPLAGVIHAPADINPADGFRLRLVCNRTTRESGGGGETETTTDAQWEGEQTIHRDLATGDGRGTLIPVKFLVPYNLPPSGDDIAWQLEVKAETLGVDYFAVFEVPVFRTAASSAAVTDEGVARSGDQSSTPDLRTAVARMNAVLEQDLPDSRVILFPMGRNVGMSAFLGLFTLIWTILAVGMFSTRAPRVVPWGLLALDLLFVHATIKAFFSSTRLAYSPRGIEYAHRLLGLGRTHELLRSGIQSVAVNRSGTKVGNTAYRRVIAESTDGDVALVKEIARSAEAEVLAADIRRVLGLDEESGAMPLDAALPKEFSEKSTAEERQWSVT